MAANTVPKFINLPLLGLAALSAAETDLAAPTASVLVATGKKDGTVVQLIRAVATQTTTDGMIRWYLKSGGAFFLWQEMVVTVFVPSANKPAWSKELVPTGGSFTLPEAIELHAATEKGETFSAFAFGGDLG